MRRFILGLCVTVLALGVVSCPIGFDSAGIDEPLRVSASSPRLVHHVASLARSSGVCVVASAPRGHADAELLEPVSVYAATPRALLEALPSGAAIALPRQREPQARALKLLARKGILRLREGSEVAPTRWDIVANPRRVRLVPVDLPATPLASLPRRSGDRATRWSLVAYDLSDIVRARAGAENDKRIATLRALLARASN